MKKLIFTFFIFLYLLVFTYAGNEIVPFSKNMKIGESVTLSGSFVVFNGWQPNIRFITDSNKIIGIGTDEEYCNKVVNDIVLHQIKTETIYRCEAKFNYIDSVKIHYYDRSLMCFAVSDIKIKSCFIEKENEKINIDFLKFNPKTKQLKCKVEIFNPNDFPINYSNMFLNLKYEGENLRAYIDSPASNIIDFTKIKIPANENFEETVYFSFNNIIKGETVDLSKIEIIYQE